MGSSNIDPRHVETARLQLAEEPLSPDDVDTDRSLSPVAVEKLAPSAREIYERQDLEDSEDSEHLEGSEEPEEPEAGSGSPWRLNALGAALLTALLFALFAVAGLKYQLIQARGALAEAENAAEAAESAVAREPADDPSNAAAPAAKPAPAAVQIAPPPPVAEPVPAPPLVAARAPRVTSELIMDAPPKRSQLVLLLTVGTQHYAEKQVRALKLKCAAPLAVYRQRRGRCAYSQCFAVAVPIEDAESASGCGRVRGQSVRDRGDFVLP